MMSIFYSPIVGEQIINYSFENQIITATIGEITDTFDFSAFPDGEVYGIEIETTLPIQPINRVEKNNGVLFIELLNFIGEDATEFERFPEWIELGVEV